MENDKRGIKNCKSYGKVNFLVYRGKKDEKYKNILEIIVIFVALSSFKGGFLLSWYQLALRIKKNKKTESSTELLLKWQKHISLR